MKCQENLPKVLASSGDRFDDVGSKEVSDQCQERVKNLISLLKSAQRCWKLGIYINLILKSQGPEGNFFSASTGGINTANKRENEASQNKSSGNTAQIENSKVLVLLLMLQPENCHQGNPGNVENQVEPLGFGAQNCRGGERGACPCLTQVFILSGRTRVIWGFTVFYQFPGIKPKFNCSHQTFVVGMWEQRSLILTFQMCS